MPSSYDERIERAANAILMAQIDSLVEKVSAHAYDPRHAVQFFKGLDSESDRATPVLIFAFMENAVKELFSAHLSPNTPGGVKSLFEPMGPLATASARFKMLAAIEWISVRTAADLDIARKIRNDFAHDPPDDGFLNPRIRSLIDRITAYEAPLLVPEVMEQIELPHVDPTRIPTRQLFLARMGALFFFLVEEILIMPRATRMGLPADIGLAREYKKLPPNIKSLREGAARLVIHAIFPDWVEER
jgi:hypothetical protein